MARSVRLCCALPVEVVPFGWPRCKKRLTALGCPGKMGGVDGKPVVMDNHNCILDCQIAPLNDPTGPERAILAIPGVVGAGLFWEWPRLPFDHDGMRKLQRS